MYKQDRTCSESKKVKTRTAGIAYSPYYGKFYLNKCHGKMADGKRNIITGKASSEKEAIALLRKKIQAFDDLKEEKDNITLNQFAKRYFVIKEKNGRATPNTVKRQYARYNNHVAPYLGNQRLQEITAQILEDWQQWLQEETPKHHKQSNNTIVRSIRPILLDILKKATGNHIIQSNPIIGVTAPKTNNRTVSELEEWELEKLLATAKLSENKNMYIGFMMLYYTGMRVGELLGLTWGDIDFFSNSIHITKQWKSDINEVTTTKTVSSIRGIPLFHELREYLLTVKRDVNVVVIHPCYGKELPKNHLDYNSFKIALHTIGKRAGVENVNPHRFRHSFATRLTNKGVNPLAIQKMLGHTSGSMTDHYIGDVQELLQSVVRQNENEKEQNVIQLKNKGVQGI